MEEKRVKVRLKEMFAVGELNHSETYEAIKEGESGYCINGELYSVIAFEEVKEDVLMVECIEGDGVNLELGEIYEVYSHSDKYYWINKNKWGASSFYPKEWFKPVPKEKEIKEYTVMELFEEEEGTIFNNADAYFKVADGKLFTWFKQDEEMKAVPMLRVYLFMKFTKVEEPKPVSTSEAWKSYMKGNTIKSVISGNEYGKIYKCDTISIEELENQWIIE